MPTYDLKCPKCGERVELFCSVKDRLDQHCSKCYTLMDVMPAACAAQWLTDTGGTASGGRMTK